MQIPDILYAFDQRNRPGRASLIAITEAFFDSGSVAAGGADINFDLPRPSTAFARRWEFVSVTTSGLVAADRISLVRSNVDVTFGSVLWTMTGSNYAALDHIPLIGGRLANFSAVVQELIGVDAFIVSPNDNLRIVVDFGTPVAQTARAFGWYKDIPF